MTKRASEKNSEALFFAQKDSLQAAQQFYDIIVSP